MDELTIVSIVATGDLGRELDLSSLSDDIDAFTVEYNKEKPPGMNLKLHEDGPTISLFRTGSFNIRGAKTSEEISENKLLLENRLSELGIDISIPEMTITNIVFTADLGTTIDLNEISLVLGLDSIEYEPEQFSGLVYRLDNGVVMVFSSGKLVLTGFTQMEEAERAYKDLKTSITNG